MAKSIPAQKSRTTPEKTIKKPIAPPRLSLYERVELFLEKNHKKAFYILLCFSLLFSLLLFDMKISTGGDDASYIQRAYDFVQDHSKYPSYQGPLYPLILSLPLSILGLHLVALKMFSVLFALGHLTFMYLAFRRRIPWVILFTVLGVIAVNKFINYYSSQTYSESFFMFMQALFFYVFFRFYDRMQGDNSTPAKNDWKQYLLVALSMFLLSITKNVSLLVIVPVVLFLLFRKAYKPLLILTAFFLILKVPYELGTRAAFGTDNTQIEILQRKHPYDVSQGKEDISGYFKRLTDNFKVYLAKNTLRVLGLRAEKDIVWNSKQHGFLAFLLLVFFIVTFFFSLKRNKYVLFTILYVGVTAGATFLLIQTFWDSERLIIILVPLILLVSLYGFFEMFRKSAFLKSVLLLFCGFIFLVSFVPALGKVSKNASVLKKNIKGDIYAGYSNDWVNYLEMSRWIADNLPEDSYVAVRKPSMSFIYGRGKRFYGVFEVTTTNPDTVMAIFKQAGVTHIVNASLRSDPNQVGRTINTIDRLMQHVPASKLMLVKEIGATETTKLYEIKY